MKLIQTTFIVVQLAAGFAYADLVTNAPEIAWHGREDQRAEMQRRTETRTSSPEAHLWLAKDLLLRQAADATPDSRIRDHLQKVIAQRPDSAEAHELLARWHVSNSEPAQALHHLQAAADERPELRFVLAKALLGQGKEREAGHQLLLAKHHYKTLVDQDPTRIDDRLELARAELYLKRYDVAAHVIRAGQELAIDPRFDAFMATIHVAQADELLRARSPQPSEALSHLRSALNLAPHSTMVLDRLSRIAHQNRAARDRIRDWLVRLATEQETAEVRLVLGNIAASDGDFAAAVRHYEQGRRVDPHRVELIGNLAWCLFKANKEQLHDALLLSQHAVQKGSDNPRIAAEFQVTHGLLLVEAQRWQEAIAQLEQAAVVLPNRSDLKQALKTARAALGKLARAEDTPPTSRLHALATY